MQSIFLAALWLTNYANACCVLREWIEMRDETGVLFYHHISNFGFRSSGNEYPLIIKLLKDTTGQHVQLFPEKPKITK